MDWITARLKEPTTYLALAVGGVGLGFVLTMPVLTWIGIVGGIFGIVLKEKRWSRVMSYLNRVLRAILAMPCNCCDKCKCGN